MTWLWDSGLVMLVCLFVVGVVLGAVLDAWWQRWQQRRLTAHLLRTNDLLFGRRPPRENYRGLRNVSIVKKGDDQ